MSLVRNEQTKLTATYLNNVAVALFVVGSLTPLFSMGTDAAEPSTARLIISGLCLVASVALHIVARRVLRRLQP